MRFVLDFVYLLLISACSPWLAYAAWRHGKYRQGWKQKLWGAVPHIEDPRPCAWLHAVSVGEVNLLVPLLEAMKARFPGWRFAISTTTRTGYELAERRFGQQAAVFYCPLDFSWATARAMRRIRPRLLVLAELELWPNLIAAAHRQQVSVVVINGRLSERSFRGYRRVRWWMGRLLRKIDLIAAQNDVYAQRFVDLGADPQRVVVTGSIKFDGAQFDRQNTRTQALAALWAIPAGDIVLLAGSTQQPEERLAIETMLQLQDEFPQLRLIVTPRHAERFEEVAQLLDRTGVVWQRRSQLAAAAPSAAGECGSAARILLVDTIGELQAWWGLADIAFVGGSLGQRGGQNMLEPAAYGAAVCFGPNTRNFRDIVQSLLAAEAAVVVHDGRELTNFVRQCLERPSLRRSLGERARAVVASQQGATSRTVDLLEKLLRETPARRSQELRPAA